MGHLRDRMDAVLQLRGLSENARRLSLRWARDFAASMRRRNDGLRKHSRQRTATLRRTTRAALGFRRPPTTYDNLGPQWMLSAYLGDGVRCAADIAAPVLVVGNLADDACMPTHPHRLCEAVRHPDKTLHEIEGANHWYLGPEPRPMLATAVGHCTTWLETHGLAEPARSPAA